MTTSSRYMLTYNSHFFWRTLLMNLRDKGLQEHILWCYKFRCEFFLAQFWSRIIKLGSWYYTPFNGIQWHYQWNGAIKRRQLYQAPFDWVQYKCMDIAYTQKVITKCWSLKLPNSQNVVQLCFLIWPLFFSRTTTFGFGQGGMPNVKKEIRNGNKNPEDCTHKIWHDLLPTVISIASIKR